MAIELNNKNLIRYIRIVGKQFDDYQVWLTVMKQRLQSGSDSNVDETWLLLIGEYNHLFFLSPAPLNQLEKQQKTHINCLNMAQSKNIDKFSSAKWLGNIFQIQKYFIDPRSRKKQTYAEKIS